MNKRHLLPERLYRFIAGDKVVGRFLLYSFRREMSRGNIHEARHIMAAVQMGNSQPCDAGDPCILDGQAEIKIPAYPGASSKLTTIHTAPEPTVADVLERLELISVIAVGSDIVETAEQAIKRIELIAPVDLGQPGPRWPELREEWRRPLPWLPATASKPDARAGA